MHRALMATSKNTAWLVAIGPLTNVALLIATYPEVSGHIKGLSIMGGVIGNDFSQGSLTATSTQGTFNPYVEFNIACDPESARCVFQNHPILAHKTVLIPLDLTHQACVTSDRMERLYKGERGVTKLRRAFYELLMFCESSYAKHAGMKGGAPLHDPLAVAALLFDHKDPISMIGLDDNEGERWDVDVILEGDQAGRLVVTKSANAGILIPRSINFSRFWSTFEDCMSRADEATGFETGDGKSANL
jgi:uridine nucleosidase